MKLSMCMRVWVNTEAGNNGKIFSKSITVKTTTWHSNGFTRGNEIKCLKLIVWGSNQLKNFFIYIVSSWPRETFFFACVISKLVISNLTIHRFSVLHHRQWWYTKVLFFSPVKMRNHLTLLLLCLHSRYIVHTANLKFTTRVGFKMCVRFSIFIYHIKIIYTALY